MSPSYLVVLGLTYSRVYFLPFCWSAVYCRKWTLWAVCFRLSCLLGLVNGRQCGGWGGVLEGHGREKSGIFPPLLWAVFLKVATAETSPGSRFWTGHCGSSFCQVTIVYVFLQHCVLPLSLVDWESSSLSHRGSHSKYLRLCRLHSFCWNFSALWMGGAVFKQDFTKFSILLNFTEFTKTGRHVYEAIG